MPNGEEIANTIKGLEDMQDTILLFQKYEQGEGRKFPVIHLEGTGHWLNVDASLFCITNALQVLNKRVNFHGASAERNDGDISFLDAGGAKWLEGYLEWKKESGNA